MRTVEFRVTGRVQGVGFRFFTSNLAGIFKLDGEVWNCHDGSVCGIVTGEAVDAFLKELTNGPGRVDTVTHSTVTREVQSGFQIGPTR